MAAGRVTVMGELVNGVIVTVLKPVGEAVRVV